MSDTSVALFTTFLVIAALCALFAYAVRRVGPVAPGRLVMVIGGLVAFAAALPAIVLALRPNPASEPANAPAPHSSTAPAATTPTPAPTPSARTAAPAISGASGESVTATLR